MANTKSTEKRIRSNAKKAVRNLPVRTRVKTTLKDAHSALDSKKAENATTAVHIAIKQLDRAVSKKIIHKNNAARRKSRLTRQLNTLSKAAK
ncbi:30S ribosomal protein S20 [Candidatus Wirthbacteria bacterium CG2_30_54_11]|uniref:Small ribosomal subunit protein bS20 n=1 Tax=Candidatus Wirthbacteria bacterium CG2_30_54_11 TaxID=1817892 RepID=A0A1J5ISV8_9BACT|nr:MAG: 30S ribosomal protein S20 [Candidatus Wirthbacteria bacterium CG2_30_54_11]